MAISLEEQEALALDTNLSTRIKAALVQVASTVQVEAPGTQNIVTRNARQALVVKVLQDPSSTTSPAQGLCANNATIQNEAYTVPHVLNTALVPDSDIVFVITSQWNTLAGLRPGLDY